MELRDIEGKFIKGNQGFWLGKKRNPETIEKIKKWRATQVIPRDAYVGRVLPNGSKHHMWAGTRVGYRALHMWVERYLGKPTKCMDCGKDGLSSHQIHWANISGKYKRNLIDWRRLCVKCHKKLDKCR